MKNYIVQDAWNIIERGFDPELNQISESLCSIGNGRMGQRANFEEKYSGETLQGSYIAGVYYPDATKVGWWKNGYPRYFGKVINSANWIGLDIEIDGEDLDLAKCKVSNFERTLRMKEGYLERSFTATTEAGVEIQVNSKRFCSIVEDEIGALRYSLTVMNKDVELKITPYIDFDIENQDANYDEKFWVGLDQKSSRYKGYVTARTAKNDFDVERFDASAAMYFVIEQDGENLKETSRKKHKEKYVGRKVKLEAKQGQETVVYKYAALISSLNYAADTDLGELSQTKAQAAAKKGFDQLLQGHIAAWAKKWESSDIIIKGDVAAQQGIRFCIFQMHQTYTGEDDRLNIGPKGFTGEKYGGLTYWDTEAYCFPFYLSTAPQNVARNLLVYRHKHLQKAIENAAKLGFKNGAALYPMVTITGEECHNEWEITFEEIHRNGAIAFAIYDYVRYTGDAAYLADYGLEVLIGIARFWAQRVSFSEAKQKYVMLGVTGPNEYENNVNNNWYTNYMAAWCMDYCREALEHVHKTDIIRFEAIVEKTNFDEFLETNEWSKISENMFYPENEKRGIFLQQEGYMDKEQILVNDLPAEDRPLNQKWSWDRILRSCFIKQADTLQGLYFFEDRFDTETIQRNFDFYEPRTVHESSLSPCVHAVLAAKIGNYDKAYEMYLRTARLDLDDYNNDTEDGCHITSMAGTWVAFVQGFGGMRVRDGQLHFAPFLPEGWEEYAFKIKFRGNLLQIVVQPEDTRIINESSDLIAVNVNGRTIAIDAGSWESVAH
ncbi:MAG: family 65 glycosyl hydrolase domain-containing protein [Chitinophagales bacterium]